MIRERRSTKGRIMTQEKTGKVVEVIGPVVVAAFEEAELPPIYNALRVVSEGFDVSQPINVVVEVEQHLGEGRVKCVAMAPTEMASIAIVVRSKKVLFIGPYRSR